jgi:hypothetical protein
MFEFFAKSMVSAWLWSISWGWLHIPINTLLLMFMLIFVARLPIMRSILCSVLFTLGAFVFLSVVALIFGFLLNDFTYTVETWGPVLTSFQVSFYLGFLYTIAQEGIYFFVAKFINTRVPILLFISNMITALVVYLMLPLNAV